MIEVLAGAIILYSTFERSPTSEGWITRGSGASWVIGGTSGTRSIRVQHPGPTNYTFDDAWSSPLLNTTPLQWYRLSFNSKAPGTTNNPGSVGYGYWSATFYDKQTGNQLPDATFSSVFQSNNWVHNEFRFRTKATVGANGNLLPVQMRINFHSLGSQPLFIDDITVQATTSQEVAQWADGIYNSFSAKLNYVPKASRWQRIPLTMQKLRNGQNLRIVMLGDSIQNDTATAPIDVFLEREYPGSKVEIIPSVIGGTGVQYYKTCVQNCILKYKPDLLIIGGISNGNNMSDFQSVVNQVRASDRVTNHKTEILLLTKAWSPNNYPNPIDYQLNPSIKELDQNPTNNTTIPNDYRGNLLWFAYANNLEYLDMTGIQSEFIYGPATAAGLGSPDANGNPYSIWMRDNYHLNDYGKQILGRILETYFSL
ncbi:MAG: hypothetical protein N4J56_005211 [Chroococcidiopsis sp. SAG 2025]|uniref:hypothetical protein n=1 Tax=Chroococcidiopsis sp. SAG 2025 TaxID=171389 RepID=UPI0029370F1A|nr:hypothetical protein [Chroococcidiopsis sp. SAG 2025]MDV2995557.1 hypothetical protein [Chroococcidiopsis sp. SAG 2025]